MNAPKAVCPRIELSRKETGLDLTFLIHTYKMGAQIGCSQAVSAHA